MITVVHVNIVTAYNTSNSSLCATPARVVLIVISKAMPARMPAAPYPPLSPAGFGVTTVSTNVLWHLPIKTPGN